MSSRETIKENLGRALRLMLKPVAKLLVDQGISHREFAEAAKDAYVSVAVEEQLRKGTFNRSRVAIVTGLTRKEVAAVISRAMAEDDHPRTFSRPSRVLHGWHNDPEFVGPYGVPLEVPYDAEDDAPSFVKLVKTYSGDQSATQMLEELIRIGAVVETGDHLLRAIRRDAVAESLSPKMIERMGEVTFHLLTTITANVQKKSMAEGIFERVVVSNQPLSREEIKQFDGYLKSRGQGMLVEIDNWLTSAIRKKPEDCEDAFETGVAMIHYTNFEPEQTRSLRELLLDVGIEE
ncbi:MAG: DUF6502 family protein [Pseudomonadota bacterium]